MTTAYDVNEVAVQGIAQALQNASQRWEAAGAPGPATERQREQIRTAVKADPDVSQARELYRMLVHWTTEAVYEEAQAAKIREIKAMQKARQNRRAALVAEMKELREQTGLSQTDMAALLGFNLARVRNIENEGSFSISTFENALERYRAIAKLRGLATTV